MFLRPILCCFSQQEILPAKEIEQQVEITADNAYILQTSIGTYELWVNGTYFGALPAEANGREPLDQLLIRIEGEWYMGKKFLSLCLAALILTFSIAPVSAAPSPLQLVLQR